MGRFHANPDQHQYAYLLTKPGMREETRITVEFLKVKVSDYETLKKEIEQVRGDLDNRLASSDTSTFREAQAG